VIVIGTGAGGGTLAYHLAPSGKRTLLLERGGWLPREKDNWDAAAVFIRSKYRAKETWYDEDGRPFHPGIHYYVGGNTKLYGAALFRLRVEDFREIRHVGGLSPAWPIPYEDLAPYYTKAEYLYHVHGQRGLDPTEPPEAAPYRHPPVRHEPRIQRIYDHLGRLGLHPFPTPLGILLDEDAAESRPSHTSRCIRCNTFDGFPCLVDAKADAAIIGVVPALRYPNVTLLTNAYVRRLETDPSGREVTRVCVERGGAAEVYAADIVVVACGAINSAALLLRSASDTHPNGLANRSDVVGRHYMRHHNSVLLALSREPNPTVFQNAFSLHDFYLRADDWAYPLGHLQMLGKSQGEMLKAEAPSWAIRKPELPLDVVARHAVDFWLTSEDLPDPENRVTVDGRGELALRLVRERNLEAHTRLVAKLKDLLHHVGCDERYLLPRALYLGQDIPLAGTAHQVGTIRFGHDPTTSALDVHCKAHDVDNLYVVDGSFFVSSGAVNPALTIMANALRVGDHLLERLGVSRSLAGTATLPGAPGGASQPWPPQPASPP
jgi:choline dehydrogenase-like flavoprotein